MGTFPVTMLDNGRPEIVAKLIAPLVRAFTTERSQFAVSASQSAGRAVPARHRDLISLCSGNYAGKATSGFGPRV
jgi:hypothetical protein